MKMKNSKLFITLFLFVGLFAGCSNDDDSTGLTAGDLLPGTWGVSSVLNSSGQVVTPECEKDDSYTFVANGSGTFSIGLTACNANDQTFGFTWQYFTTTKVLKISAAGQTDEVILQGINQTSMTLINSNNYTYFLDRR